MPEIGQLLGDRYRLAELLGEGGMATIFLAHDEKLGRDVAVKLLRPEYGRDQAFVARFRQEAHAAASLSHPNVVQVFDYGTDEAGPYIVMEYVDGQDLAQILRDRGFVPSAAAARIAMQAADGLAAAHALGVVHRDVKPSNILVSVAGQVKVADFGIARALAEAQLTLPGQTLGSVPYLSPEQARGEPVTAATDIYALGLVLSEMLTGRAVWTGDTAGAVAMARLTEDPPVPSSIRPDVNPALDSIVGRALARDPAQRFGSAGAFSDALGRFLSTLQVGAGAPAVVGGAALAGAAAALPPVGPTVVSPTPAVGVTAGPPPNVPYDDEPEGGSSRWTWGAAILGIAILAVAGIAAFLLLGGSGGGDGDEISPSPTASVELVVVPDVVDLPVAEARTAIEGQGLVMVISPDTVEDPARTPGTVAEQDPPADTELPPEGQVTVTLVAGPGAVAAPNLVGQTEQQAIVILTQDGLAPGVASEAFSETIAEGVIISQSPPAGTMVATGTAVDYVVSSGPEPTPPPTEAPTPTPTPTTAPTETPPPDLTVNDYRCLALSDAEARITEDGFSVGKVTMPGNGDPSWTVVSQAPAAGSTAKPGTRIDLDVVDPASLATCPP